MRTVLIMTLVLVLAASVAFAQLPGRIGVFGVQNPTTVDDCAVTDDTAGLLNIYLVHVDDPSNPGTCATACQFKAELPGCTTASYLADGAVFGVTIGNSQTGVSIGYGLNLTTPIHVLTVQVFASGTTPPCCVYEVGPDPAAPSGEIEVVDCNLDLLFAAGQSGVINPDGSCPCSAIVPAEPSSWGKIKAMYSSD
ncbi:MAG: hypothetical protein JSW58_07760 [Candidatus Latescibacterota bacterium]|nr:MAG: hypothetical protein JSW58_07760 [Candidatus Latescibacterota bacterium]